MEVFDSGGGISAYWSLRGAAFESRVVHNVSIFTPLVALSPLHGNARSCHHFQLLYVVPASSPDIPMESSLRPDRASI